MKIIKKTASLILAIMMMFSISLFLSPAFAVSAEGDNYYAVSGIIYDDGEGIIERVEIVFDVEDSAQNGGSDYVIIAEDYDYNMISSKAFSVKFSGYPDGIGEVSAVPFTVLIPYDDEIYNFSLRNSYEQILFGIVIDNNIDVSDFEVTENEDSFSLSWSGADYLTYDVTAVSEESGQRTVLLFRSEETSLEVPFEWVEPNDTVVFELTAQNGNGTSVFYSDSFDTPEGEAAIIADADGEDWDGNSDKAEKKSKSDSKSGTDKLIKTIAIVGGAIVLAIIAAVIIIVLTIKKKKQKN
jgi:hypothetical protein